VCAAIALVAAGCTDEPPRRAPSAATYPTASGATAIAALPAPPISPDLVPDALPRVEPRSLYGNPPFYDQFGKRYVLLPSASGYVERGVASWYGPGFHAVRTSTREPYDMYGMTAAHKTLPLPCYVRVTNLQNGRSVVVRVNDRGPFIANRIIDLSYTAAAKLDMLRNGTAMVEVRAIDPTLPLDPVGLPPDPVAPPQPATATASATPPAPAAPLSPALFVQAGAFADPANAERLVTKLQGISVGNVFIRENLLGGRRLYRVRIGPVPDVAGFDRVVAALENAGVHDAHLAPD
jgi:rare lipoprotein A